MITDIEFSMSAPSVNVELLDSELRAALGEAMYGLSIKDDFIIVHVRDKASAAEIARVKQVVAAHDPSKRTPAQEKLAALETFREQFLAQPLDLSAYDTVDEGVTALGERVAWLEAEFEWLLG